MNEAQTRQSGSLLRRRPVLAAALAIAVIGSAGFTAAGGIDMVKAWILTVEVEGVDGTVTINPEDVDITTEGDTTTITIDEIQIDGIVEEGATATITATNEGATVQTTTDANGSAVKTITVNGSGGH